MGFRKEKPINFQVESAHAARAIYTGARELPRVAFQFKLEDGRIIEFELPLGEAGKFIEQGMSAYNAIIPPLKTSRGGFGI